MICEIMNEDGTMARVRSLSNFAGGIVKMISVADLIRHRIQTEKFVERGLRGRIRTAHGDFEMIRYMSRLD